MSPCQAPLSTTWALPSAGLTQEMPVQCLLFARNGASCLSLFSALDPPGSSAGPAALSWQGRAVQVQGGQSSGLPSWPGAEADYRRYNLRGLGAGRGLRGRGAQAAVVTVTASQASVHGEGDRTTLSPKPFHP